MEEGYEASIFNDNRYGISLCFGACSKGEDIGGSAAMPAEASSWQSAAFRWGAPFSPKRILPWHTFSFFEETLMDLESARIQNLIYRTEDPPRIARLEELLHKGALPQDEAVGGAADLLEKAWHLCYLAYKQVDLPPEGQSWFIIDCTKEQPAIQRGSARFIQPEVIPCQSAQEMREEVYCTFEGKTAQDKFWFITALKDIDGELYCSADSPAMEGSGAGEHQRLICVGRCHHALRRRGIYGQLLEWHTGNDLYRGIWILNEPHFAFLS